MVDARGGSRRDVHAAARHHDRECRAALDPESTSTPTSPTCSGWSTPTRCAGGVPADLGSIADLLGRRLVFIVGLAVFTTAPRSCAGSRPARLFLNLARGAAGRGRRDDVRDLAGAARRGVPRPRARASPSASGARRSAQRSRSGRWSAASITDALGWEWIFFVNVPIGDRRDRLHAAQGRRVEVTRTRARVDWPGPVTFCGGAVPARLRADPRQRPGLGLDQDRRRCC